MAHFMDISIGSNWTEKESKIQISQFSYLEFWKSFGGGEY